MTKELKEAAHSLLKAAPKDMPMPTSTLLQSVERAKPALSADVVRHAYWDLVNRGALQRSAGGVRKVK
jgi:hypothetical protein